METLKLCLFLALSTYATAYRILIAVPMAATSHTNLFAPLAVELGRRGHQVTYVTPNSIGKPSANVTEILIHSKMESPDGKEINFFDIKDYTAWDNIFKLPEFGLAATEVMLKSPVFQDFLKKKEKFDVFVCEAFVSEGFMAGVSRYFGVPLIGYQTFMPSAWTNYLVGNEAPTSYLPDPLLGRKYGMDFRERMDNFLFTATTELYFALRYLPRQDALMRKYFGNDLPYVTDIVKNMSILFINDHFSSSFPRPAVPNMVGINGLHVRKPKPLPQDLQDYLDGSKEGAILFSLGSNIKSALMPPEKKQMFLNVFSKLKQNVLWKFETSMPEKPKNVKISKWLPQSDILAHPKIQLFITHGGLLSTTEAIDRGVPIVGLPIFGDQPQNMRQSVNSGIGLSLNFDTVTEEELLAAIKEVLQNPRYREATKLRSARYHDRIVSPMDLAVYWIEYVVRHNGAPHLRSAVQDLTWYQRYQIDVLCALTVAFYTVFYIIKKILSVLISCMCGKSTNKRKND